MTRHYTVALLGLLALVGEAWGQPLPFPAPLTQPLMLFDEFSRPVCLSGSLVPHGR